MTYKPGDKKLVEAEIISVLKTSPAYAPCYKCDVDGREVLVRKEFIHPAPEYKNGEDVMVRFGMGGPWRPATYVGQMSEDRHAACRDGDLCWVRAENIRRLQKKYTVELTEKQANGIKRYAEEGVYPSLCSLADICKTIAEQCHD